MNNLNLPVHVAIIPDGNRRWAREKGLPVFEGHRIAAEKTLPRLIEKAGELGIKYLTFWALSTENKERDKEEINNLFKLMRFFLRNKLPDFKKKGVKLKIIGNLTQLPEDLQKDIINAEKETDNNNKITLIIAINYGGKDELIRSIKKIQNSEFTIKNLTKEKFNSYLDTAGIPDPELIIRTSGERRLSGFMLWQSEYSELYFSDKFFPDFNTDEFDKAIRDYSLRQRRFGR